MAALTAFGWTAACRAAFTDLEERPGHTVGAIDTSYSRERPRFEVGSCYFQAGHWLEARLALAGLRSPGARLLDAVALQELGHDEASLEALDALEATSHGDARIALFQARAYARLGRSDSAQSALAKARDLDRANRFGHALAQIRNLADPADIVAYTRGAGDYPYASLALEGYDALPGAYTRLRLEGGCNVARTPIGDVVLRGSVATMQPVSQADAQGIVTTFGAQRAFGFSLGPIGARADATAQYTNLNLGGSGFADVYSVESGFLASAGRHLDWGLRYRSNYGESHLAAPADSPPAGWLHQLYAVTNWRMPVTHGAFTVGASAGYLIDRVGGASQNGGWLVALNADYPVNRDLKVLATSSFNNRDYRAYVTREVILFDRPEDTWLTNIGLSYAVSPRTNLRLEWLGACPASDLKDFSYSNLLFTINASY